MSVNSKRIENDLKEDVPSTSSTNVAGVDLPIGTKPKDYKKPTNSYINVNKKRKLISFKEWREK